MNERIPHTVIPFAEARVYRMTFGMYRDWQIDDIGASDRGLLWLDWARGACDLDYHTRNALCSYLDDPTIAKELTALLARKRRHR